MGSLQSQRKLLLHTQAVPNSSTTVIIIGITLVDPDEVAENEIPQMDLQCLLSNIRIPTCQTWTLCTCMVNI